MAHQGPVSGGWTRVVPWDRQGNLNLTNTAYLINFCRRYRLERPTRLQGPDPCKCGWCKGHIARSVFDGDHDEADCPKRAWARTMTHNTMVDALCRFLSDCGMVGVGKEVKYWDNARIGADAECALRAALDPIQFRAWRWLLGPRAP
eukprot:COSAG02_NODE_4028_length_5886_cov_2.738552_3_plen_147_part_00